MKRLIKIMLPIFLLFIQNQLAHAQEWHFTAFLDDEEIGYHHFTAAAQGNGITLKSEAEFNVKFLFINAYSYVHNSDETWQGNCLQTITSTTDDNGKQFSVSGSVQGEQFIIKNNEGSQQLPTCIMTFAYWNPDFLSQKKLLNVQDGNYLEVEIKPTGQEMIMARGTTVPANRYQLTAKDLNIQLWYSTDGDWLQLESLTKGGYKLSYRLL